MDQRVFEVLGRDRDVGTEIHTITVEARTRRTPRGWSSSIGESELLLEDRVKVTLSGHQESSLFL